MTIKKVKPIKKDKKGNIIFTPSTLAAEDWIRAGRLKKEGKLEELKKMEDTSMFEDTEDEQENSQS